MICTPVSRLSIKWFLGYRLILTLAFCLCIGRACIIFPFLFFPPFKKMIIFLSFFLPSCRSSYLLKPKKWTSLFLHLPLAPSCHTYPSSNHISLLFFSDFKSDEAARGDRDGAEASKNIYHGIKKFYIYIHTYTIYNCFLLAFSIDIYISLLHGGPLQQGWPGID